MTEPLPVTVRHKVYAAEYVGDVASSDEALQSSPVVEGTPSGTILIGASRERVGFDRAFSRAAAARLARGAIALFPVLAGVQVMRSYLGFRPYCPDHLPIIGPGPARAGAMARDRPRRRRHRAVGRHGVTARPGPVRGNDSTRSRPVRT